MAEPISKGTTAADNMLNVIAEIANSNIETAQDLANDLSQFAKIWQPKPNINYLISSARDITKPQIQALPGLPALPPLPENLKVNDSKISASAKARIAELKSTWM